MEEREPTRPRTQQGDEIKDKKQPKQQNTTNAKDLYIQGTKLPLPDMIRQLWILGFRFLQYLLSFICKYFSTSFGISGSLPLYL